MGRKLYTLLEGEARLAASIDGAIVVEEVTTLLNQLVDALNTLQEKHGVLTVYCLYHAKEDRIVMQKILSSSQPQLQSRPGYPYPPVLNQAPEGFLVSLTDHYLFAVLHNILYTSLMAENHNRVTHLDGAVKRLDDKSAELKRQCNILRQEEITEEIELILLSAASLDER